MRSYLMVVLAASLIDTPAAFAAAGRSEGFHRERVVVGQLAVDDRGGILLTTVHK